MPPPASGFRLGDLTLYVPGSFLYPPPGHIYDIPQLLHVYDSFSSKTCLIVPVYYGCNNVQFLTFMMV